MFNFSLILFIFISAFQIINSLEVSINTNIGQINGYTQTIDKKEVNIFLGIPYAEPPINELRFKKPVSIKKSRDPINATKWSDMCYQTSFEDPSGTLPEMSEDCLYLNIYAPKTNLSHLIPVMIWIHGGALLSGSANEQTYNSSLLASRGHVIVVAMNYRLNTLGFLYTGTDDAPGNVGLYDQLMAIKWVNDNIVHFGGDPKEITIFGESAGGWSVSFHILSPMTRNLFKNAVMMSGSSLAHLAVEDPNISKQTWAKGAKTVGCGDGKSFTPETIKCLKNVEPKKLVFIPESKEIVNDIAMFIPLVVYGDEFLPKKPIEMLKTGNYKKKLNLLMGTTSDEGTFFIIGYDKKYQGKDPINMTRVEGYNELKHLTEKLLSYKPIRSDDVAKVYFSDIQNDYDVIRRTIGVAMGDYYLLCPTLLFGQEVYRGDQMKTNVYQYYFTHKMPIDTFHCPNWAGACHGSPLNSWFGMPLRTNGFGGYNFTDDDKKHSEIMMNVLTYFAKNGHPPPQDDILWPKYYSVNDDIVRPYYEFSMNKQINNFGSNLKNIECKILWKPYIEGDIYISNKKQLASSRAGRSADAKCSFLSITFVIITLYMVKQFHD